MIKEIIEEKKERLKAVTYIEDKEKLETEIYTLQTTYEALNQENIDYKKNKQRISKAIDRSRDKIKEQSPKLDQHLEKYLNRSQEDSGNQLAIIGYFPDEDIEWETD
ncbi:hypothetical protein [Maridesulfovibrio sp.]|uniref:hypothetical protein n=1 Tax=Maridesulfovibrio sp. TaxID=2795000 RepID=UPI003AFFA5A8